MLSFFPNHRLKRHLLFWAITSLYFLVPQLIYPDYKDTVAHYFFGFDYEHSPYFLIILFFYVLSVGMLYAYAFLRWAAPPLLAGRYVSGAGMYLLITVSVCYLFRLLKGLHMAVLDPLLKGKPFCSFDSRHFSDFFLNQVYIHEYSSVILVLAVYKFFTNWQQKQHVANRLEREKISTEIQLLKTQVNPDFLVDSLEQLKTLTQQRSRQGLSLLLNLAQFLRYVLYETRTETVPLASEVSTIRQYVALQRSLHDALEISFTVRGDAGHHRVIPLSLLPIIERAFASLRAASDVQAWVSIDLAIARTGLTMKVIVGHTGGLTDYEKSLAVIRKQLYFHYGDAVQLEIVPETDVFIVNLTLRTAKIYAPSVIIPATSHHEITLPDR